MERRRVWTAVPCGSIKAKSYRGVPFQVLRLDELPQGARTVGYTYLRPAKDDDDDLLWIGKHAVGVHAGCVRSCKYGVCVGDLEFVKIGSKFRLMPALCVAGFVVAATAVCLAAQSNGESMVESMIADSETGGWADSESMVGDGATGVIGGSPVIESEATPVEPVEEQADEPAVESVDEPVETETAVEAVEPAEPVETVEPPAVETGDVSASLTADNESTNEFSSGYDTGTSLFALSDSTSRLVHSGIDSSVTRVLIKEGDSTVIELYPADGLVVWDAFSTLSGGKHQLQAELWAGNSLLSEEIWGVEVYK